MKAILEFQLPEDSEDFKCATNANNFYFVLWDLDQHLRSQIKYNPHVGHPQSKASEVLDAYQEIRDHLRGLMDERGLNFEMLS